MRFLKTTIEVDNKERYEFSIGKTELVILYGLIDEAFKHTPRTLLTQGFIQRTHDMREKIGNALRANGMKWPLKRDEYYKLMESNNEKI